MSWTSNHTVKLSAAPSRVFDALTNPAALRAWFAEHVEIGARPGEPFRFWGRHTLGLPSPDDARQTITRWERDSALAFRWPLMGCDSTVTIELAADGDATGLTLAHVIDGSLGVARERELIDDHWKLAFGNLISYLDGGEGILLPDYADPTPEVRLTIVIDASPEVVFRALIEPERINRWFGSTAAEVDPRVGGRYSVGWQYKVDGRDVVGGPTRILELVPRKKLVLDWPDWRGDDTVTGQTISFELEPAGTGTRLTFVHAGFGRTTDVSDFGFGWRGFLDMLATEATREESL